MFSNIPIEKKTEYIHYINHEFENKIKNSELCFDTHVFIL